MIKYDSIFLILREKSKSISVSSSKKISISKIHNLKLKVNDYKKKLQKV